MYDLFKGLYMVYEKTIQCEYGGKFSLNSICATQKSIERQLKRELTEEEQKFLYYIGKEILKGGF